MATNYIANYQDALQLAVGREKEVENFYKKTAEKVHDPDARSLLKRLAIEEKKHQKMLHAFCGEVTAAPQGPFIPPEDFAFDLYAQDMKTTADIFKIAIRQEEISLNFYARFLVYFFGTGHESIFKEIFNMELGHKEQLERNMKYYLNQ